MDAWTDRQRESIIFLSSAVITQVTPSVNQHINQTTVTFMVDLLGSSWCGVIDGLYISIPERLIPYHPNQYPLYPVLTDVA